MEMENNTGSDNTAARELAQVLETAPIDLKSLKLDHSSLVARLEVLMPAISTFARCTCVLVERGEIEDAWQGIEAYTCKFAEALDMSTDDGRSLCLLLVMMTLLIKRMKPFYESIAEKKVWEEWFQGLWEKES
jgi:hypothetical protein